MPATTHVSSSPSSNKLLGHLSPDDYARLQPHLHAVRLPPKHVLLDPRAPSGKVYFLDSGVCSIVQSTAEGETAGVALVGSEGLVGISALGGDPDSGETAVIEISPADARVMDARAFRREMALGGGFNDVVHRYAQAFAETLMQSVACNALHSVERRCARCLLEIRDRVATDEFPLTQDTLADMLGVRRASITVAAAALHRAGLIDQAHRRIVIRDVRGLERVACECYGVIKAHFARLVR